jgi:hypothetical protein
MTSLTAMDKLLFWLGLGAAQKGAGSKEVKPSRHWVVSLVAGILLALLIAAGAFILGLRGIEWVILGGISLENCAFPRFSALRLRLESIMNVGWQ